MKAGWLGGVFGQDVRRMGRRLARKAGEGTAEEGGCYVWECGRVCDGMGLGGMRGARVDAAPVWREWRTAVE